MPIHNLAWAKLALASNIMEICRLHGPRALNWVIKWKFCYFCWFLPKIVYQFAIFHLWQLCLSHSSTNNQYHMELKVSRGLKGPNLRLQAKIWQFKLNYAHDCISIFFMLIPCIFSRVLCYSTPCFVGLSVHWSVSLSVRPSVRPSVTLSFFSMFYAILSHFKSF